MRPMGSDPHEEGRVACEQGAARSDCPYPVEAPDYHAWVEGWDEAEEVKVVAGEEDGDRP